VSLAWTASTDISGYDVFRDGALATTVTGPSATVVGLTASTGSGPPRVSPPGLAQGTVSGCPPASVTTIVCSACAAREPSTVTTAQPSRLCL
jgi:hypothetical protein